MSDVLIIGLASIIITPLAFIFGFIFGRKTQAEIVEVPKIIYPEDFFDMTPIAPEVTYEE